MVDKINLEDYDFFMWEYEDQTKIKHYVFQEYIDRWIKIVGSRNSLNYFDCFGGCGAYFQDGQIYYGSPILAAEKAEENKRSLDRKVNIVIIEKEEENIENLKKIFSYKQLNIDPIFINGEFDKTINNILDNGKLAPTFFFIDPFGFKINYNTLKRVMSVQKSEIFLNFMFTRINQYLSAECIEDTLDNLFGCQEWREIIKLSGSNREIHIVELFRKQLKKIANHVFYYRMSFPDRDRTYYYLYHLTNYYKGCSIMKSAFAKYNYGNVEYRGPKQTKPTFYDLDTVKQDEVRDYLINKYKGKRKKFIELLIEEIDSVPYLKSNIYNALKEMDGNEIEIKRIPKLTPTGRVRKSIKKDDIIIF